MTVRPASTVLAFLALAATATATSACSSSSSPSSPSGATGSDAGSGSGPMLAAPPAGKGIQLKMETTIAGSSEDERCQFVTVSDDLWVNNEDIEYTPGSHHFILWHTSYTTVPTTDLNGNKVDTSGVFECIGGPGGAWQVNQFVGGAQSANAPSILGAMPADVALHIPAGSILIMDLHVLNAQAQALDTTVLMNLLTIPQASVAQEAGIYFFYNPFIRVPADGKASARMSCPITSDVHLTTGQSHMHKQGLGGFANLEDGDGSNAHQIYVSNTWTDPPVSVWQPGMAVQAGQQIDYQCNYDNTGNTDVVQGFSAAKNEMCVFAGAYYPRDQKFETCSTTGNWSDLANAATYIGTGTATGASTLQCLSTAPPMSQDQGDGLYGCIVDSCPQIAKPLTSMLDCYSAGGSQTTCSTQLSALQAATCQ